MDIFHRHQQANEPEAAAVLERALQVPAYRPEALVWKGIAALPQNPKLAFLFFAEAAQALPERADVHALVGRSLLAQGSPALATRYLTYAWKTQPNDLALRLTLWEARSKSETPAELRRMILAHLPDIHGGKELGLVLKLLAAQADVPSTIGVVRYLPEHKEIQGWAIDLRNLQTPVALQIDAGGTRVNMVANAIHPLLKTAGLLDTHGGVRIRVPNPTPAVHVVFVDGTPLLGSPLYVMPAFVPPSPAATGENKKNPVDVLIPVYDGLKETLECIDSALEARKLNRTPHRLVVIEDKTPVPALAKALKVLAAKGKITLVQNKVNLGFIRSMNRAMALSPNKDVVWLNADTRVHGAWLDRLHAVAYSADDIASVTPFTNNGELMSFPRSQICHDMPDAKAHAELDELARQVDSEPIEIETGCGFCLYIKRAALERVGYLDEIHLLRGYGEETDWCLRARGQGWRHMGAPNVFVAHQGGISFGTEKTLRVAQNNALLRKRYPEAQARYKIFTLRDPIKPARDELQRARLAKLKSLPAIAQRASWSNLESPLDHEVITLHIHNGSHKDAAFNLGWRHEPHRTLVTLHAPLNSLPVILDFALPGDSKELLEALLLLPITEIAFEQLSRCPTDLCDLPHKLGKPYRINCQDAHLLEQSIDYEWCRFAQNSSALQLPWQALSCVYQKNFPKARLQISTFEIQSPALIDTPQILLIGDNLNSFEITQRWLSFARNIVRNHWHLTLLVKDETPWLKALKATGVICQLSTVSDFSLAEHARAAGCEGVVSLDEAPDAGWIAPHLASDIAVPLFACPSAIATEAGARSLTSLSSALN